MAREQRACGLVSSSETPELLAAAHGLESPDVHLPVAVESSLRRREGNPDSRESRAVRRQAQEGVNEHEQPLVPAVAVAHVQRRRTIEGGEATIVSRAAQQEHAIADHALD